MRNTPGELDAGTRRTLIICFFAFFFNGLMTMMQGSVLPDMKTAYHLTDTQGGLMLAGHSAGNLAACWRARRARTPRRLVVLLVVGAIHHAIEETGRRQLLGVADNDELRPSRDGPNGLLGP